MSGGALGWKRAQFTAEADQSEARRARPLVSAWSEKPSSSERVRRYSHISPGLSVNYKPSQLFGNAQNQNTVIKQ